MFELGMLHAVPSLLDYNLDAEARPVQFHED